MYGRPADLPARQQARARGPDLGAGGFRRRHPALVAPHRRLPRGPPPVPHRRAALPLARGEPGVPGRPPTRSRPSASSGPRTTSTSTAATGAEAGSACPSAGMRRRSSAPASPTCPSTPTTSPAMPATLAADLCRTSARSPTSSAPRSGDSSPRAAAWSPPASPAATTSGAIRGRTSRWPTSSAPTPPAVHHGSDDGADRELGDLGQHTYLRLTPELRAGVHGPRDRPEPRADGERHPALAGFDETDILPFGGRIEVVTRRTGDRVRRSPWCRPSRSTRPRPPGCAGRARGVPGLVLDEHRRRPGRLPGRRPRPLLRPRQPPRSWNAARQHRPLAPRDRLPLAVDGTGPWTATSTGSPAD